ncbi:MAG TPA: glutamate synthase, partial [Betaproteobacteria bacterium]|nr:glutamate synthase [Betaproteobacteria bacterium]
GDTSIDVATVARRLGHIQAETEKDRPDYVIQGHMAHDVAKVSASEGAEVVLLSRAIVDKMNANKHEIDQALAEGIEIRGGVTPVAIVLDADGRAKGVRVAKLELVNGKQEIVAGSEHEIAADLVVAAIGQAVDFTGLESLDNGKGMVNADKNYQVPGKKGYFVGGDIIRPHLLTTAIGHGSIAADGIDAYLSGDEAGKRPKVDVHYFDMTRKLVEKGIAPHELHGSVWGSSTSKDVVHNFEFRADKVVIPHDQLFLGHFGYVPRHKREELVLSSDTVLGHFEERIHALSDEQAAAEAKRCMSCGICFECDNCVVYCPQDAVKKTPRAESTTGRYVFTDYTRCIGCHICRDVCPTGYIQMGLGE